MTNTKVVHCKKEPYDIYIGRPSKWGNPFTHITYSKKVNKTHDNRSEAVRAYREWITKGEGQYLLNDLHELRGKVLGCWCHPKECHGDVLVDLIKEKYE